MTLLYYSDMGGAAPRHAAHRNAPFPHIHAAYRIEGESFEVPALTIQPPAENAVRHGVRGREDGAATVSILREGEMHRIIDGQKALDWLRDHPVDPSPPDINMPKLGGITLAARIKEMHPKTAIPFLTAYREHAFDACSVRPAGYLPGPVPPEKLAAFVLSLKNL